MNRDKIVMLGLSEETINDNGDSNRAAFYVCRPMPEFPSVIACVWGSCEGEKYLSFFIEPYSDLDLTKRGALENAKSLDPHAIKIDSPVQVLCLIHDFCNRYRQSHPITLEGNK